LVLSLTEAGYLIENALSHIPFGGFGNFDYFVVGDDSDGIAVGVEAYAFAGNVVDDDSVNGFRGQFLAGVLQDILRFGSEADDELVLLVSSQFGQDVRRRLQFQSQRAFALDLLVGGVFGPVISDSCGFDDDAGFG